MTIILIFIDMVIWRFYLTRKKQLLSTDKIS